MGPALTCQRNHALYSMALIVRRRQWRVDAAEQRRVDVSKPYLRILLPTSICLPIARIKHSFRGGLSPIT